MDTSTPEQGLINLLKFREAELPRQIDWFLHRRKKARLGSILTGMGRLSVVRGVYAYFIESNLPSLKQHFHVASKLTLASVGQEGGETFDTTLNFFFALLSDDIEVINAFATFESPELIRARDNPLWPQFEVHMLQLAIRGEHAALQEKIQKMAQHGRKPRRVECAAGQDFYSLLLKRDQAGLERLITDKHAPIKSDDARIEDFMSYQAVLEAKLCWFYGIPVQIDHPLVPMALMPIEPLAHYDDEYEFLRPGWVPPPQGLTGKIGRWLRFNQ